MEASALNPSGTAPLQAPSPLLRLQSDERLVALVRRGNARAFETLVGRYESRLLAFCRHMLGSREDAEDVLQEVFAAAYNALLADERAINVRPWLYRIARNRSLNHLRRTRTIGVDSMDVHFADNGQSTAEKVHEREDFRQLIADVGQLAEAQRTALLLREIDALSYDQIAEAMETTVPSVKSLLVRARVALAESAEARRLTCAEVRLELGEWAEGLVKVSPPIRRHLRGCVRCRGFRDDLRRTNRALAMVLPVAPLLILKKIVLLKLGVGAATGGGAGAGASGGVAAGGVTGLTGAAAGGATGSAAGGLITAGLGVVSTKAAAGLAAAAIVTAGAVEVDHVTRARPRAAVATAVVPAVQAPVRPAPPVASAPAQVPAKPVEPKTKQPVTKRAKPAAPAATDPAAPVAAEPAPATTPAPETQPVVQQDSVTTSLPAPAATPGPTPGPTPAPSPAPQPTSAPGSIVLTTTTTTSDAATPVPASAAPAAPAPAPASAAPAPAAPPQAATPPPAASLQAAAPVQAPAVVAPPTPAVAGASTASPTS